MLSTAWPAALARLRPARESGRARSLPGVSLGRRRRSLDGCSIATPTLTATYPHRYGTIRAHQPWPARCAPGLHRGRTSPRARRLHGHSPCADVRWNSTHRAGRAMGISRTCIVGCLRSEPRIAHVRGSRTRRPHARTPAYTFISNEVFITPAVAFRQETPFGVGCSGRRPGRFPRPRSPSPTWRLCSPVIRPLGRPTSSDRWDASVSADAANHPRLSDSWL